jgi:hypothetical protein
MLSTYGLLCSAGVFCSKPSSKSILSVLLLVNDPELEPCIISISGCGNMGLDRYVVECVVGLRSYKTGGKKSETAGTIQRKSGWKGIEKRVGRSLDG